VKVRELPNNVWLVVPEGRLDTAQSRGFAAAFSSQFEQGRRTFIVDMALVEYVSSAGLKTLVSSWQRVRDLKGEMVLASLTPRVREVLQMTGLDLVFTLAESVQEAERRFTPRNLRS
jgi:anti-sigma B factor antagonist